MKLLQSATRNVMAFGVFAMLSMEIVKAAPDPHALLAAAKRASGGQHWDHIGILHQAGTLRQAGQSGSFDNLIDLRHVYAVTRSTMGPTVTVQGWDGSAGWSADGSGQAMPGTGKESVAAGIGMAYKASYAFFWPERYPASFEYLGIRTAAKRRYDVLRITPKDSDAFELWLDAKTHLIARESVVDGASPVSLDLADYRRTGGVLLPFSVRESSGDADAATLYSVGTSAMRADVPQTMFAPPPVPPEPDPFPAGLDRVVVPMQVIDDHLYVKASVNGGPQQTFMFDTGAIAVLDKEHARAMGIEAEGSMAGGGFGNDMADFGRSRVDSIAVGAVSLPGQALLTLDMASLRRLADVDFAGLLGVELAQRAVLRIDYENQSLTLIRPSSFQAPVGAIAMPLRFNEHHPLVTAAVDGIAGEFEIDTGSGSTLTLMAPFSKDHGLDVKHARAPGTQSSGVGGDTTNLLVRSDALQLGSATIEHPVTTISTDVRGAGASRWTAGNIGGGALHRFTVTFDYPHRIMYLEPNARYSAVDDYDRSGLKLRRADDGSVVVAYVVPESAAARAGMTAGDRISEVGGVDVRSTTLAALRSILRGPAGSEVDLSVIDRNGLSHTIKLQLFNLV